MKITIDTTARTLTRHDGANQQTFGLFTKEAFEAISLEWVRVGWSLKYYHNFSWFGLPILQLPEDLLRLQEVIYEIRPSVIVETGVYRGGSLLFHASLLEAMQIPARVIGVDLSIPPEVRNAIASHPLSSRISLIEGDSSAASTVHQVQTQIAAHLSDLRNHSRNAAGPVLVILDSGHTKEHVARELECYAPMVTVGSYIVATDGIMSDLTEVPNGQPEWASDNPTAAANEFAARHPEFEQKQPPWRFHDGPLTNNVTYWPGAWLKRIR